jgi:hypothetical protein
MVEEGGFRQRFSIGPNLRLLLGVMLVVSIVTFNVTEQKRDTGLAIPLQQEPMLDVQIRSPLVATTMENDKQGVSVTGDVELAQSSSTEEKRAKHRVLRRERPERPNRPAFGPDRPPFFATPAVPATTSTAPSPVPSQMPSTTQAPSQIPSNTPSTRPSQIPSSTPSTQPSSSLAPSQVPSTTPSARPSISLAPSQRPTSLPSALPTISAAPSINPSKKGNRPKFGMGMGMGMGFGKGRPKSGQRTFGRETNPDNISARVSRSEDRFERLPLVSPPLDVLEAMQP